MAGKYKVWSTNAWGDHRKEIVAVFYKKKLVDDFVDYQLSHNGDLFLVDEEGEGEDEDYEDENYEYHCR